MKWLFAALLALNLIMFGWWHSTDLPLASPTPATSTGSIPAGTGLVMLSERAKTPAPPTPLEAAQPALLAPQPGGPAGQAREEGASPRKELPALAQLPTPQEQKRPPEVREEKPATPNAQKCFLISEFESEEARERLVAQVAKLGGSATGRGTSRGEQFRFWVMLPPFQSAEAAAPVLKQLKEREVTDYYFIRSGENRFAVSLGVFSTREIADRRVKQLRDVGLQPEVRQVGYPSVRYRLEITFRKEPGGNWQSLLPYGTTVEPHACKQ